MIKALILDADGVIVQSDRLFSKRYTQKANLPPDALLPFFENEFLDCLVGKKDLKVELQKQIRNWGWKKSVDELLDFWFSAESNLNMPLLEYLPSLRKKGLKIYLGTNNEKYRTQYLLETVGLKNHVHKAYASYEIGHKKPAPEYFAHIIKDLGLKPNQILFIDDDPKNIAAAITAGISAEIYTDFKNFKRMLKTYLL